MMMAMTKTELAKLLRVHIVRSHFDRGRIFGNIAKQKLIKRLSCPMKVICAFALDKREEKITPISIVCFIVWSQKRNQQDAIGNAERRQEDTRPIHIHYVKHSWRTHPVIMEINASKHMVTMNWWNGKNGSNIEKCECSGHVKRNYLAKVSLNSF